MTLAEIIVESDGIESLIEENHTIKEEVENGVKYYFYDGSAIIRIGVNSWVVVKNEN